MAKCYYLDSDFGSITIPQVTEDTSYNLNSLLGSNSYNAQTSISITQSAALSNLSAVGTGGSQGAPQGVSSAASDVYKRQL